MLTAEHNGIRFTDADIVSGSEEYDSSYSGMSGGRYGIRPFLIHDSGFVVGVVFARSESDAMDDLADSGKLDYLQIDENDPHDLADYFTTERPKGEDEVPHFTRDGVGYWERPGGFTRLGNAGEPFDIEALGMFQLPNPPFSFAALFNAAQEEGTADGFKA